MIRDFLRDRYREYILRRVKEGDVSPSQTDFVGEISRKASDKLGKPVVISVASFNQWINGGRLPVGENVEYLAAVFGPVVYDILGKPRAMPDDPILKIVVDQWELLNESERDQLIQFINTVLEGKETNNAEA